MATVTSFPITTVPLSPLVGIKLAYSSSTTDGDPGDGTFRLNNATVASATAAYLDNVDNGGRTISGLLDLMDDSTSTVKGTLRFENVDDQTIWVEFEVTGSVVDGTGYRKLTLQNGASAGTFADGDTFAVAFGRTGDKGDTGADGAGDMVAANNLSDVADAPTAFGNIKQSATTSASGVVQIGSEVRERLAADRTYYVRSDGSDSNNGLANTSGGAFLTIQKAIDVVATLDLSIYDATIQVATGTYTGAVVVNGPWLGSGTVTLQGDTSTPSNVVLSVAGDCILVQNYGVLYVKGFKLTNSAETALIRATDKATVNINGLMEYGTAGGTFHLYAIGATINITADYTVSGGAVIGIGADNSSIIKYSGLLTVTMSGTPAFTIHMRAQSLSGIFGLGGVTFSGSATGQRFVVSDNAVIDTNGGGANFIPGDSAGSGTNSGTSPYGLYK